MTRTQDNTSSIIVLLCTYTLDPWLLVAGGATYNDSMAMFTLSDKTEILSLDPANYPVPGLLKFPAELANKVYGAAGGLLTDGELEEYEASLR